LKATDEIGETSGNLFVYSSMRRDEDNRVSIYQGQVDRANTLNSKVGEATAYFTPEVVAIPPAKLAAFYKNTPALAMYRHHLEDIQRQRAHTLSEKEEKMLASASDFAAAPGAIFTAFNNADLRYGTIRDAAGKEIELTKATYQRSLESPDRKLRRAAFIGLH